MNCIAMADNMSIDRKDEVREGSEDSMELNSPTPEPENAPGAAPDSNPAQQKRKGGRKPVRTPSPSESYATSILMSSVRFMPPQRSANNATGRPRQLSENAERNTSNNWKRPLEFMRTTSTTSKLHTEARPMNVLCCATKILYWREYC